MQTLYTPSQFLGYIDAITEHYDTVSAAIKAGNARVNMLLSRVQQYGVTNNDFTTPSNLYQNLNKYQSTFTNPNLFGGMLRLAIRDFETFLRSTGSQVNSSIVDVNSFASYYNTLTPYSCLIPWEFAYIYYFARPNVFLSNTNVYAPGGPVQTLQTLTSTATGSNFTLTVETPQGFQTTASIAWNASASTIQTTIQNLVGIGTGNVICAGGTLNSAPVTMQFTGILGALPLMVVNSSLTGGSLAVTNAFGFTTGEGQYISENTGWQLAHGVVTSGSTFLLDNSGAVPTNNAAPAYPNAYPVQGYSPFIPELVVGSTAFVGTGNASLVFTGLNQLGLSQTWTANVVVSGTGAASGAIVAMTPGTGGDRMQSVSSVAVTGTISAGNWSVRVQAIAGRPN